MNFRIADTFTDSLGRLTNDEQKAVKTTAFDLQMNPAQPSLSLHKLDRARDKHFWSVFLARQHPEARLLLTTFSDILANALRVKLRRLTSHEPHLVERVEVESLDKTGVRLYKARVGEPRIIPKDQLTQWLKQAAAEVPGHKFSLSFLLAEWEQIVDAWQLRSWEDYRDVKRLGRKTRLPEPQRQVLWSIFERVEAQLAAEGWLTRAGLFGRLTEVIEAGGSSPYDFVVVDEAQDLAVYHLRFLAALGASRPDALFFAGDLGQRIFQQPFSWKSLGVDVRGRAKTLHVNYRTSHQIRRQADLLLAPELADVDGNVEERGKTVSVFNGPPPEIRLFDSEEEEINFVGELISQLLEEGLMPNEIGVFVRSTGEIDRAVRAVEAAEVPYLILDESVETLSTKVSISTMHLAKGLEFKAVVVMACDDEVIPSQERIENITDNADLEDVYNTERHLLYVACTRARDQLLVTSVAPSSEFLEDIK